MCFHLPNDWGRVPDDQIGVYSFRFRFPSDYELGLTPHADEGSRDIALRSALFFFRKCCEVSRTRRYRGTLALRDKASHLAETISLSGEKTSMELFGITDNDEFRVEALQEIGRLKTAIDVLRRATTAFPALYVGMTREQSFRMRLLQHLAGETTFAMRLQENKLPWQSLQYCIEPVDPHFKRNIRIFEKLFQVASNPIFSDA